VASRGIVTLEVPGVVITTIEDPPEPDPPEPDPKAPSIAAICSPIIPFVGAE
jgi:hypothetical protein